MRYGPYPSHTLKLYCRFKLLLDLYMFDFEDYPDLELAYTQVLDHPAFKQYNRSDLASCATFCDMLRQAPQEVIVELRAELAEIALETDDHNEASGFLMLIMTLGGGLTEKPPSNRSLDEIDGPSDLHLGRNKNNST